MIKLFKKPWDNRQGYKFVDASGATFDMMAVQSPFNKGKFEIVDEIEEDVIDKYFPPLKSKPDVNAGANPKVTRLPKEDFKDGTREEPEMRLFAQAGGTRQQDPGGAFQEQQ